MAHQSGGHSWIITYSSLRQQFSEYSRQIMSKILTECHEITWVISVRHLSLTGVTPCDGTVVQICQARCPPREILLDLVGLNKFWGRHERSSIRRGKLV